MDAVLHFAESLMTSPWLYLLVLVLVALDGIVPVVPAETVVIAAAAYATTGQPQPVLLLVVAWSGALIGDVTTHHIGRGAGPLARWFRRRRWGDSLLGWAERELTARGGMLLISARFIPGGRTATTLTSGVIRYPRPRLVGFAAVAGLLWSLYNVGIGMLGGLAFQDRPMLGVALGIGLAVTLAGMIEGARTLRRRGRQRAVLTRRRRAGSGACPAPARAAS